MNTRISTPVSKLGTTSLQNYDVRYYKYNISTTGTFDKFVSDTARFYVIIVVQILMSGLASVVGMTTNILNIVVFIRQGVLSDTSNTSLLGLAVADFLCVATMLWTSISHALAFADPPGLTWDPYDVMYLTAAWPHVVAGLITRVITAFVALERCVCVVFPFKVKIIFSPRSCLVSIICIFVYFMICYTPVYFYHYFDKVDNQETNTSQIVLVILPGFTQYEAILGYINLFTLNFGSVVVVIVCTVITVSRVKLSKAWRESMSSGNTSSKSSDVIENESSTMRSSQSKSKKMSKSKMQKEKKLIRMITFISLTFLVCYLPNVAFFVMYGINQEIRITGKYQNLAWVLFSFTFLSETVNSGVNIVLYYKMSGRYRRELNTFLGMKDKQLQ